MTSVFQESYDSIFKNWYRMRLSLENKDIETQCIETDQWWQNAPLVNHYLHIDYASDWPDPWELLAENTYCTIARGLGMFYTLYLLGIRDIEFVQAKDYNNEDVYLVLVNNAKYILNYWPNTVVNNNLKDFVIIKRINSNQIIIKIGLK